MSDFTLVRMGEADRTYLARLNFLTDVFGNEDAETSEHFLEEARFYLDSWKPASGGFVVWDGAIPAGGVWLNWGTERFHGAGFVEEGIPEVAIAVESRYRGRGLASLLLSAVADLAQEMNAPGVSLAVATGNESAYAVYEHLGFSLEQKVAGSHYVAMVKRFKAKK